MKKDSKFKFFILGLFCFCIFCGSVNAASVSVKANVSSVTVGGTVVFTTTVSSDSALVSIEGSLVCSGAGVNGGTSLTFDDSSNSVYSKKFTYTAKPTKTGTVVCTINGGRVTDMGSGSWKTLNASSVSVTVKAPVVIPPKEYSSDNTLSSLSVDGYDISPKFNKNTLEYTLEVDQSVEKIKVNAKANHNKASVNGTGEKTLTPGKNIVEIKVTAENGNNKVYKITINSVDQNPIVVNIDDKKYTVVKKNNDVIAKLNFYEENVIKINDQDIVSYHNQKSDITLVILKDSDNKVNYYIYNADKNEYQLYKEYKIGNITLYLLDILEEKVPKGYKRYDLTIGEDKLEGYKLNKNSKFYLINAMNIENGNESLYLYDEEEGTVQRYDEDISKYFSVSTSGAIKDYKNYFMIAVSAAFALIIVLIIVLVVNSRENKRKRRLKI